MGEAHDAGKCKRNALGQCENFRRTRYAADMKVIAAVVLLLSASAAYSQQADLINADRPGIADSSGVVGPGIFQIEAGLERDHDGADRSIATPLLLRYGVSKEFEMRVEGNGYVHADGATGFA